MEKLPNLYSLRFFLALMVVVFHIPTTSYTMGLPYFNGFAIFNKGLVAVNFFFTLSGFLIIRNFYLDYKKSGKVGIKAFYIRRIRRLWPVYYLVIVLGIALYHLVLPQIGIAYTTNYSLSDLCLHYVFFIPNVFNASHQVGGILNIVWSVGVEEQFYLVFPLLFLLFRKRLKQLLVVSLLIFVGLLFVDHEWYFWRNFYFYFVLGGLYALLAEEGKLAFLRYKVVNFLVLVLFVLTFVTDWFMFNGDIVCYHLFNLAVSCLFITTIAYFPLFDLDRYKTCYFGKISYGIYMYHMIVVTVFLYAVKLLKLDELISGTLLIIASNLIIIALTLLASHLSYQYFEKRFYSKS